MNQKGLIHLQLVLIAVLVFVAVGFTGFKVLHKNTAKLSPLPKAGTVTTKVTTAKQTATTNKSSADQQGSSSQTTPTSTTPKKTNGTTTTSSTSSTNTNTGGTSSSPPPASTNPTISVLSPTSGEVVTGNEVTYDCSYTTPAGFSEVDASTTDKYGQDAHTGFSQGIESAGCRNTLDITYLDNGTYTVTFTIHDSAGKTASASRTYTVQH